METEKFGAVKRGSLFIDCKFVTSEHINIRY